MKDAYEVLYQKEGDLARVRKEIESLAIVAQLLEHEQLDFFRPTSVPDSPEKKPVQATSAEAKPTDGAPFVWPRLGLWGNLKIKR